MSEVNLKAVNADEMKLVRRAKLEKIVLRIGDKVRLRVVDLREQDGFGAEGET